MMLDGVLYLKVQFQKLLILPSILLFENLALHLIRFLVISKLTFYKMKGS